MDVHAQRAVGGEPKRLRGLLSVVGVQRDRAPGQRVERGIARQERRQSLRIECVVRTTHRTGVEMEALTGATVAALTVYDMCKALSHAIVIGPARLLGKRGGKRDFGRTGA